MGFRGPGYLNPPCFSGHMSTGVLNREDAGLSLLLDIVGDVVVSPANGSWAVHITTTGAQTNGYMTLTSNGSSPSDTSLASGWTNVTGWTVITGGAEIGSWTATFEAASVPAGVADFIFTQPTSGPGTLTMHGSAQTTEVFTASTDSANMAVS